KDYVVSIFIERLYGHKAAIVITIMILWVALASLFALLLGYSRIPYAAAQDGIFLKAFGKLHPTKNFPYVSLLVIGALAFVFSMLFKMSEVISGILAMRIIIQFIAQAAGVILLRRRKGTKDLPYKMPLYPLPVIVAIIAWLLLFCCTGVNSIISFAIVFCAGLITYLIIAKKQGKWPYGEEEPEDGNDGSLLSSDNLPVSLENA
ncbi:MAG TPA: amino acid permease, partial [Ferruginibacter sp.]|nr:amino acid permease [Ferruginibacter sp.]